MTGFERHFEGVLEKASRSHALSTQEGIVRAWILKNVDQHGSEGPRAFRTGPNQVKNRTRVESARALPRVNLLAVRHSDLKSQPVLHIGSKMPAVAESTPDMEDRLRLEVAVADGKEIHSWE